MASTVRIDEAIASAIGELKTIIRSYDPNAHFEVAAGPDAGDIYLVATVDTDDADDVMALYIDRLVEMQVEDRLPLYVLTVQSKNEAVDHQVSRSPK